MKAILRRVGRLEQRFVPKLDLASQSMADIIRERRRRRLGASGEPFEDLPPASVSAAPGGYLSIAETIRLCRQRRLQAQQRAPGDNIDPQSISPP